MSKGLILDPTEGAAPRLMFCLRCGQDTGVALMGVHHYKGKCPRCGTVNYGLSRSARKCLVKDCGGELPFGTVENIPIGERVPDGPCKPCTEELFSWAEEVKAGGVYWQCTDCHGEGVIKSTAALAAAVRKHSGIAAPASCGVAFTKENCPACGPEPAIPAPNAAAKKGAEKDGEDNLDE